MENFGHIVKFHSIGICKAPAWGLWAKWHIVKVHSVGICKAPAWGLWVQSGTL